MTLFDRTGGHKLVLGMVHLQPLPGTPFHRQGSFPAMLERAVGSAVALRDGGADGCLVQTVDRVYGVADESDPARTAAMGLIVRAIVEATGGDLRIGVQLMRNAVKASLAVAKVAGGSFIRAGAIVGRSSTPHGVVEANPLDVMEYRAKIDAWDVAMIADVDSMHFRWLDGTQQTAEVARQAARAGADAVALGRPDDRATLELIASVRRAAPDLPVVLAGHTNHGNASRLLAAADGVFVGTCLKRDGAIDVDLVRSYVDIVRRLDRS